MACSEYFGKSVWHALSVLGRVYGMFLTQLEFLAFLQFVKGNHHEECRTCTIVHVDAYILCTIHGVSGFVLAREVLSLDERERKREMPDSRSLSNVAPQS